MTEEETIDEQIARIRDALDKMKLEDAAYQTFGGDPATMLTLKEEIKDYELLLEKAILLSDSINKRQYSLQTYLDIMM